MIKYLFLFLLSVCSPLLAPIQTNTYANAQILVLTRPGAGGIDTTPPAVTTLSTDPNPVYGSATITVQINFSKPVTGFVVGDITTSNCSLSSFTAISQSNYTVVADPSATGAFTIQVFANVCTDLRGVLNIASNPVLTYTLAGSSGDLQNASEISLSQHYRGHVASFTDCNDLLSSTSVLGMELICSKYNFSSTMFANGNNSFNQDLYDFGRYDFGIILSDAATYPAVNALITTVRDGNEPTVMSYKNGVTTYASDVRDSLLYGRNSGYEAVFNPLPYEYIGLTSTTLNPRAVVFRDDYFAKTTTTDYYRGKQSKGDSLLAIYVNTVLTNNGWYSNFVHQHWQMSNYPEHYFAQLVSNIGSADVFRGSVNDVVGYYYVKESVTSITGSGATITVNHVKDWPSSPYRKIKTTLWVKLNTTGSTFAGLDISASNGLRIRKISANIFYVPILLNFYGSSTTVDIATTGAPNYVNLSAPVIGRTGNAVTVNQPCKLSIYKVHKPTTITTSVTSAAIPTVDNTSVSLTVAGGLSTSFPVDRTLKVSNDGTHYFYATVTSYNNSTGALVISSSSNLGTGTFSSWTIERYYHLVTAEIVERTFSLVTSYTITATLDNANYDYYVAAINADGISAVALNMDKNIIMRKFEEVDNLKLAA